MNSRDVFVVVPAYNEGEVLRDTLGPLIAQGYSVVVVDDCSTDHTQELLAGLPVVAIRHPVNLGQGAALQTGMEFCKSVGAQLAIHFDADGQHDYRQIADLVAPICDGRADIVFGSRFLRSADRNEVPRVKRVALKIGIVVSGVLSGVWLSDTHNGFRALSRKALEAIDLREAGFAHATEILEQTRCARLRYLEVATTIRYTDYSRAKGQRLSNGINIVLDLILRKLSI